MLEPRLLKSHVGRRKSKQPAPKVNSFGSNFTILRTDIKDSTSRKSRTEAHKPARVVLKSNNDGPKYAALLKDNMNPQWLKSKTDRPPPNLWTLKTEKELPEWPGD